MRTPVKIAGNFPAVDKPAGNLSENVKYFPGNAGGIGVLYIYRNGIS